MPPIETIPPEWINIATERFGRLPIGKLLKVVAYFMYKCQQMGSYIAENEKIQTAIAIDGQHMLSKIKALEDMVAELEELLLHTSQINQLQAKEIFGRGTEKLADIMDAEPIREETDEAEVEDILDAEGNKDQTPKGRKNTGNGNGRNTSGGRKRVDLSKLPHYSIFKLNVEELDRIYGKGNWRINFWNQHTVLKHVPEHLYVDDVYTPVISVGLEHSLVTVPYDAPLWQHSFADPSIVAWIMYMKFAMALPVYRIGKLFKDLGVDLSRQLLNSWLLRAAEDLFRPIYDHLKTQMLAVPYHQCDETTFMVIHDGRNAGRLSYFWVHTTSELFDTTPIILFCFELTRSTEHLRDFYENFQGYITCDAYCSYQTLETEKNGEIIVTGCMMHLRRRFVKSFDLIDKSKLDEETIAELPEMKALIYIQDIYNADEPLKVLTAEERQSRRDQYVRPLVEAFYNYIESLDINDPLMGEKLKDAIQYALNQKEHIVRFLDDGNIPLDNGKCERIQRPLCLLRKNSLFCNSISGAEAVEVMCTIVETAKANGANVYWYLRYVLEKMPRMAATDDLGPMMPWSEEYRQYEHQRLTGEPLPRDPNEYDERPMTPKKEKKRPQSA